MQNVHLLLLVVTSFAVLLQPPQVFCFVPVLIHRRHRSPRLLRRLTLSTRPSYSSLSTLSLPSSLPSSSHLVLTLPSLAAQRKSSSAEEETSTPAAATILEVEEYDDEDAPANIPGNEFFGGNRQKEELFDPVAEARATLDVVVDEDEDQKLMYRRFDDTTAFDTALSKEVAQSVQHWVNTVLYVEEDEPRDDNDDRIDDYYKYAPNVEWDSPFQTTTTSSSNNDDNDNTVLPLPPILDELNKALDFYRRVDVAIVAGTQTSDTCVKLTWYISVAWPIFWEPRVVLTGTSLVTIDSDNNGNNNKQQQRKTIVKQVDRLHGDGSGSSDLLTTIIPQVLPRFWDTYHIGMTPSAELMSRLPADQKSILPRAYKVYDIQPRLVYMPALMDTTNDREDAMALVIPNHAFCTLIKTMGPRKQRYVPTSPVEVQLSRGGGAAATTKITWRIPISVELQTNPILPLPGKDRETLPEAEPTAEHCFEGKRRVATIPYGGAPQDVEVADVRKQLYDAVTRDGYRPKLDDETGRPQFFFLQNNAKACYTDGGLGMGVYDWRPRFVKANEVGIELELDD